MALANTSIYSTSLEEVPANVTAPVGVNPTSDAVYMAFLSVPPPAQPTSGQWNVAGWQSLSAPYVALCLVGPGGTTTLTAGQWYCWVKITASPEVPVKYAGILQVSLWIVRFSLPAGRIRIAPSAGTLTEVAGRCSPRRARDPRPGSR
jgi:hypothetical protein